MLTRTQWSHIEAHAKRVGLKMPCTYQGVPFSKR